MITDALPTKTPEHRAKIAASKVVRRDEDPDRWQVEYEIALFAIQKRLEIQKKILAEQASEHAPSKALADL